ncbi:hypothetical protein ACHQM5_007876 [Ranunculus cassubicifolius]
MNSSSSSSSSSSSLSFRPPFTPSQWQELEHQALIFKYLMAGLPVPPELVIPIKRSFDSPRFFHHPTMGGYCSFYGKKPDPEPGRCRRTDGKKWRCAKDAYADSKYCERHMHRGRNRSRKPVETTAASSGGSSSIANFHNLPLQGMGMCNPSSQLQLDPLSYEAATKGYRYHQGMKQEGDDHGLLADACVNARGVGMGTCVESNWRLMPTPVSSISQSKPRMQSDYPQMQTVQDVRQAGMTPSVLSKQHCFFGDEYGLAEPAKQEGQPLRPFFDEWPKMNRDSWCDLDEERSNRTQLSISIPMASSDFSATSSQSANDD